MANFKPDDLGFDLEIRGNIFVNSQIYPAQKKVVVSFLEQMNDIDYPPAPKIVRTKEAEDQPNVDLSADEVDNFFGSGQDHSRLAKTTHPQITDENPNHKIHHGLLQDYYNNGKNDYGVTNNEDALKYVAHRIKSVAKSIQDYDIEFENLATLDGYINFAKRYGVNRVDTVYNETEKKNGYGDFKIAYDTDDDYDPNVDGVRIGYNSLNYDQTMIAHLLGDLSNPDPRTRNSIIGNYVAYQNKPTAENKTKSLHYFYDHVVNENGKNNVFLDAEALSNFNTQMFENAGQFGMASALGRPWDDTSGRAIYNSWKISNRFIDVSAMNPKRISLKRCAMALGYKIQESDTNREPTENIPNLSEMADLFAYNVNDIYVTLKLFESPEYYNRYTQNKQLLAEFPYLIYEQDPKAQTEDADQKILCIKGQDHVSKKRLTVNDTSTSFVTKTIAPYDNTKIHDNYTLNLNYPDAQIAKELDAQGKLPKYFNGKPRNVLDYIKELVEDDLFPKLNVDDKVKNAVRDQYQKIYDMYSQFIGKNFNEDLTPDSEKLPNWVDKDKLKPFTSVGKQMTNTSTIVQYIAPSGEYVDDHNNGLGSYVNLSIGGTHGVEVRYAKYMEDERQYQQKKELFTTTADYLNNLDHFKDKITIDNLAKAIAQMKPDEPFTHVKKTPLPFNDQYTFGDLMTSGSSRKRPKLKQPKEPKLFDGSHAADKYAYTSSDPSNHEDFDSYYPSLISQLAIFRNVDGNDVFTNDLYHPRLKLKKMAKDKSLPESERAKHQLRQLSMKLLVNAASGGGDAKFTSNIKCNNKMMAMRIIGQLFCWYIGQTLALFDARIPSTNTDGLYAMNIEPELNDRLVEDCAADLILKLDPERLDLFVSKDANNRLESNDHKVDEARGSALTSWQGPSTQNSIDHPAIIDYVLAQYLAKKADACNQDFDESIAKQIFNDFVFKKTKFNQTNADTLRFFQFPLDANPKTCRYHFLTKIGNENNQKDITILNNTNRIFLVKSGVTDYTVKLTGLQAVQKNTVKKRLGKSKAEDARGTSFRDITADYNDYLAQSVIKANLSEHEYNLLLNSPYDPDATVAAEKPRDMKIIKISNFDNDQTVKLYNEDLHDVDEQTYDQLIHELDMPAYLRIVKDKFEGQWKN